MVLRITLQPNYSVLAAAGLALLSVACSGESSAERNAPDTKAFGGVLTFTRGTIGTGRGASMVNLDVAAGKLSSPAQISGVNGTRNHNGEFAFAQRCNGGWAVFVADAKGAPVDTVLECAQRSGFTTADDFYWVSLSPDGSKVAVEVNPLALAPWSTLVLSREGEELARHPGFRFPTWTADGRLLLVAGSTNAPADSSDAPAESGLWMSAVANLQTLKRVDGGKIKGAMGPAAPHPSGESVAFEYAGGIYRMSLDGNGSEFERFFEDDQVSSFPVWDPTGTVIAFLLWDGLFFERAIYFYDTASGTEHVLPTGAFLNEGEVNRVPLAPLSWNRR